MSHVAAGDDQTEFAKALPERLASSHILAPGDTDDTINKRRRLEEIERVLEDGPPVDLDEDLVDRSAHSRPLTAGDDDRSDAHRAASTRTRTCAAWQSLIMSAVSVSSSPSRVRASASASRSKIQGPTTCTGVSRSTVRRTLPATTSLTVSLMGRVKTSAASVGGKLNVFATD